MFLRLTDFNSGEYHVPNVDGVEYDPVSFGNTEKLQSFIDKYEPKALVTIFGYDLYLILLPLADSTKPNRLIDNADVKYDKLINGDISVAYAGIINALKSYVYYHYLIHISETLTSTGVKRIESKSTSDYTVRYKMTNAWNDFKVDVIGLDGNTMDVRIVYGDLLSVSYYSEDKTTIHGYIYVNKDSYPEFKMQTIESVNRFDI
jgi:hypothetical protein